jgi:hypothetical protein
MPRPSGRGRRPPDLDGFFDAFLEPMAAMPPGPLSDQEDHDENDPLGGGGASSTAALTAADVDSAFIVWDRRSDRCRIFGADLAYTWSDERRYFYDRDQLSFPAALSEMGLR